MAAKRISVSFQVTVVGGRSAGKSTLIRAVLNDSNDPPSLQEEDADGFQLQKVTCQHNGLSVAVDVIELPADARYMPLLHQFGTTAACLAFVVNMLDANAYADLSARLAALGSPPPCGLLAVQGSLPPGAAAGEERSRLEPLRDIASRWGLQFMRFESIEQLSRARLLQTVCGLVLHDVTDGAEPMHLLGRRVAREG
eukprot:gb/GFBE01053998.1/.p1 GENE.gb/GFBE01053998.1/~~gb/GFBE01053998.1/.p1  ORF type:complete len:197 (+),score=26.67 gb/GFBE01053998.1/:1-591(+)